MVRLNVLAQILILCVVTCVDLITLCCLKSLLFKRYFHTFHNQIAPPVLYGFMFYIYIFFVGVFPNVSQLTWIASLVLLNVPAQILILCVELITFVLFKIFIIRKGISTHFTIKLCHQCSVIMCNEFFFMFRIYIVWEYFHTFHNKLGQILI